jgi:6-phosphogluconolactonase
MKLEVLADAAAAAARAAEFIAAEARDAVRARGVFSLAVSGGSTPWLMLRELARLDLPWQAVQLFQVDERIAPAGDTERNLTHIGDTLLKRAPLPAAQVHAMLVNDADLEAAAARYAQMLQRIAGSPAVLDLVHLGLGPDGHTASLVPGDAVLGVTDADVALTASYMGRRRMTLTYPMLNRARHVLWLATGADKRAMVTRLRAGDAAIPAGRVDARHARLFTDRAAVPPA